MNEVIINPCDICESLECDQCDIEMNEFVFHPVPAPDLSSKEIVDIAHKNRNDRGCVKPQSFARAIINALNENYNMNLVR